jgi:hypothetical protein
VCVPCQELLFFQAVLGALTVACRVNFFITLPLTGILQVGPWLRVSALPACVLLGAAYRAHRTEATAGEAAVCGRL